MISEKKKRGLVLVLFIGSLVFAQEATEAKPEVQVEEAEEASEEVKEEASTKMSLTLDQAVKYAMENSRDLKSADIDLEIKKRAGNNAWNVLLPSVTVSGSLARSNKSSYSSALSGAWQGANMNNNTEDFLTASELTGAIGSDNESAHWSSSLGVNIGWNLSLSYIGQIRAAKADYEAGKISYEQSLMNIEVNVKKLFYGLLLEQENLNLQKATLENSRDRMVQAQANFNNGMVPELSLLQAQVTYENMVPEVSQQERDFNTQMDTFAFILGMPVEQEFELEGGIDPIYAELDFDSLLEKYGSNSLDLQAMEKNIEYLKHSLDAANLGSFSPTLSASWGWQPTLGMWALTGSNWGDFPSSGSWSDAGALNITLSWNLVNLLPFSQSRQQAKDIKANLDELEIQKEALLENQKIEVRKDIDTLIQAREQISSMDRSIALAQRSYDMTLRAYRNGTMELLDVRDAENQLNQAKLGLAQEKYNYISALLDLETTLNTKLVGGEN